VHQSGFVPQMLWLFLSKVLLSLIYGMATLRFFV
jgi:hypothetical protein